MCILTEKGWVIRPPGLDVEGGPTGFQMPYLNNTLGLSTEIGCDFDLTRATLTTPPRQKVTKFGQRLMALVALYRVIRL